MPPGSFSVISGSRADSVGGVVAEMFPDSVGGVVAEMFRDLLDFPGC